MNSTISGIDAVLKVQKPANDWEWYVCRWESQIEIIKYSAYQAKSICLLVHVSCRARLITRH